MYIKVQHLNSTKLFNLKTEYNNGTIKLVKKMFPITTETTAAKTVCFNLYFNIHSRVQEIMGNFRKKRMTQSFFKLLGKQYHTVPLKPMGMCVCVCMCVYVCVWGADKWAVGTHPSWPLRDTSLGFLSLSPSLPLFLYFSSSVGLGISNVVFLFFFFLSWYAVPVCPSGNAVNPSHPGKQVSFFTSCLSVIHL